MIKLFKKEKNFQKRKENMWLNINLYWKIAVCFMLLVAVVAYFFGYYLFIKINKESALTSDEESGQIRMLKKDRIDKALEYFLLREQKSEQILNSPAPIIDPSL